MQSNSGAYRSWADISFWDAWALVIGLRVLSCAFSVNLSMPFSTMSFAVCFIHDNFCMVLHVPHSPICEFMGKIFLLQFMQVYIVSSCRIPETVIACSSSSLSSSEVEVGSIVSSRSLTSSMDTVDGNDN